MADYRLISLMANDSSFLNHYHDDPMDDVVHSSFPESLSLYAW